MSVIFHRAHRVDMLPRNVAVCLVAIVLAAWMQARGNEVSHTNQNATGAAHDLSVSRDAFDTVAADGAADVLGDDPRHEPQGSPLGEGADADDTGTTTDGTSLIADTRMGGIERADSATPPSLSSASIEFDRLRGLRNASIEFDRLRGLRAASIEFEHVRGLRHVTIEFSSILRRQWIYVDPDIPPYFGSVTLGRSVGGTVTVTNLGCANLTIDGLEVSPQTAFSLVGPPTVPLVLDPHESLDLAIRFSPSVAESVSASLDISSNDAVTPRLSVPLSGEGVLFSNVEGNADVAAVTTQPKLLHTASP